MVTVFLYWSHLFFQLFSQGAFGYVLPIISFILAWIETWFLDFKVLPQEAEEENSKFLSKLASRDLLGTKREGRAVDVIEESHVWVDHIVSILSGYS